jgi:hypothetical protein
MGKNKFSLRLGGDARPCVSTGMPYVCLNYDLCDLYDGHDFAYAAINHVFHINHSNHSSDRRMALPVETHGRASRRACAIYPSSARARHALPFALKGQHIPAQGNALGIMCMPIGGIMPIPKHPGRCPGLGYAALSGLKSPRRGQDARPCVSPRQRRPEGPNLRNRRSTTCGHGYPPSPARRAEHDRRGATLRVEGRGADHPQVVDLRLRRYDPSGRRRRV